MSKNIVIAGKDYSKNSKVSTIAKQLGMNAFVTTSEIEEASAIIGGTSTASGEKNAKDISLTVWHRNSPISAKTIIVNAENKFEKIDAALVFFETAVYNQLFSGNELQDYDKACDEIILGYQFLVTEFLRRFEKKQHGKIFFILQSMQSLSDYLKLSSREQMAKPAYSGTIASTAQQAFRTFAENIAAVNFRENNCPIYLVETESNMSEQKILEWILPRIEEPNPIYKNAKQAVTWITPDEKNKLFGK